MVVRFQSLQERATFLHAKGHFDWGGDGCSQSNLYRFIKVERSIFFKFLIEWEQPNQFQQ